MHKKIKVAEKSTLSSEALTAMSECAIESAQAAGKVLLRYFGGRLKISEKKNAGLVTNADFAAQKASTQILLKEYPDYNFLTEEASPVITKSPGRWVLDPLDGTTNFVHGFPMFCVSLAAEWENEVVVAVIYHPVLFQTFVAVKGRGATLNGVKIRVSETRKLKDALLTTGFAYSKGANLKREIDTFAKLSQKTRAIRRPGSAALDLAYTAQGVFDGFWEQHLSAWDVAAGSLLVTEAGGKVTDFDGKPFNMHDRKVLASNGHLHKRILPFVSKS